MNEREDLKAFLDGELTESRMAEVQAALDGDPELRQELDQLRQITHLFKSVPQPQPYGMEDTLIRLQTGTARRRVSTGWWFGLGLAGAGALAVVMVLAQGPRRGMTTESSMTVAMNDAPRSSSLEDAVKSVPAPMTSTSKQAVRAPEATTKKVMNSAAIKAITEAAGQRVPAQTPKPKQSGVSSANAQFDAASAVASKTKSAAELTSGGALVAIKPPVEVRVDSVEDADKAIDALLTEHHARRVPIEKSGVASDSPNRQVEIEVDEADADKFVEQIKALASPKTEALSGNVGARSADAVPASATGSGAGIGGASHREVTTKKRRIVIVLIKKQDP